MRGGTEEREKRVLARGPGAAGTADAARRRHGTTDNGGRGDDEEEAGLHQGGRGKARVPVFAAYCEHLQGAENETDAAEAVAGRVCVHVRRRVGRHNRENAALERCRGGGRDTGTDGAAQAVGGSGKDGKREAGGGTTYWRRGHYWRRTSGLCVCEGLCLCALRAAGGHGMGRHKKVRRVSQTPGDGERRNGSHTREQKHREWKMELHTGGRAFVPRDGGAHLHEAA
mmetsp:Transcript_9501/g.23323  ORF Transcript_9501/g.23323 Transcript_9501/m.23323 type:complete len:227 (+) Transcript_9501:1322-2002(+)